MLGRNRSGVGAGVGVDIFRQDSESESLKIRRLRSLVTLHIRRVIESSGKANKDSA